MADLWRVAVGSNVKELEDHESMEDAWNFLEEHMANQEDETAIVFENNNGYRVGEIWERSMYQAHAETPNALRMYLNFCGLFDDPESD
ncbi:hypothetical protein HFK89_24585 [Ralstonia pseudosolanacearum]|uniref:hypothetical protein n=1 Tax=Ralstonia pseudosolanacearum TaxID=1310165 RepID=UPI00091DE8CC|nr:hypothetical protein [Ralstonia pseudosolanacearum]MCK4165525.1 hypothetical protein [Ralstonia pseudosolanacearum]OIN68682.1 hypothetical protein BL248_23370 [Ralstonia solanacearum]